MHCLSHAAFCEMHRVPLQQNKAPRLHLAAKPLLRHVISRFQRLAAPPLRCRHVLVAVPGKARGDGNQ